MIFIGEMNHPISDTRIMIASGYFVFALIQPPLFFYIGAGNILALLIIAFNEKFKNKITYSVKLLKRQQLNVNSL